MFPTRTYNCSILILEQNLVPSGDISHESQPCAKPLLDHSQNSFTAPPDQLEEAGSLPNIPDEKYVPSIPDEKYGYRISVDSLFSTSFFSNPQTGVKSTAETAETRNPQHNNHMAKNQKCQEPNMMRTENSAMNSHMVKNQKGNEALILYNQLPHNHNQLPHNQILNDVQQLGAGNPCNMKNNTSATQNHLLAKNQKCIETTVLSSQVAHGQLLNEPPQFDAVNPNKINNPSLLDYQPLPHSQDSFKKNENFDTRLVSPRRVTDPNKATLESPPPVIRNLVPHVGVQSACADTLIQDPSLSLKTSSTRTYRNFTDQPKNGNERLPNGKMTGLNRDDTSPRSLKADVTSDNKMMNNVVELNRGQEASVNVSITKNSSNDVQTESLVNVNYREISKLSSSLQTDGFPTSESKEPGRCPTTSEKTPPSTKVASTGEDVHGKNEPPLLGRDVEDSHVHQGTFPHGPFLPNPFLSHSLLTHRQAIPSAFVYPSRVGLPGSHSGFTDVAQHTNTNPGFVNFILCMFKSFIVKHNLYLQ